MKKISPHEPFEFSEGYLFCECDCETHSLEEPAVIFWIGDPESEGLCGVCAKCYNKKGCIGPTGTQTTLSDRLA